MTRRILQVAQGAVPQMEAAYDAGNWGLVEQLLETARLLEDGRWQEISGEGGFSADTPSEVLDKARQLGYG